MELAPGDIVSVPLGASEYTGVVWGEGTSRPGLDNRLKDVELPTGVPLGGVPSRIRST